VPFHKKPISSAVYKALMSLCDEILQKGKLRFLAAFSSSCASPTTTYVLFRPKRVTIRSKHDSLPGFGMEEFELDLENEAVNSERSQNFNTTSIWKKISETSRNFSQKLNNGNYFVGLSSQSESKCLHMPT
jgi:hypothetical protein